MYPKSYQMLGILQGYAPNDAARQMCADTYDEMSYTIEEAVEEADDKMVSMICGLLKDGIDHGNWLWLNAQH
jgi:hypothetical protein